MSNCVSFEVQVASILEVLAKAAAAEITKLVDDKSAALRSEICRRQTENQALKRKLLQMESELRALRGGCAEGTPDDSINISFEVQVCDEFREAQGQCVNRLPTEAVVRGRLGSCGSVSLKSEDACLQPIPIKREPVDGEQDWPESQLLSEDRLEEDSEWSQSQAEQCFNTESSYGTFGAAVAAADSVAGPLCVEVEEPHMQPCSSGDPEKRLQVEPKQEVLPLAPPPPRMHCVWSEASSMGEILQNHRHHRGMGQQREVQMPMSSKERAAKFRAKKRQDPVAWEEFLEKRRASYHRRKEAGTIGHQPVRLLTTSAAEKKREQWRRNQSRRREKLRRMHALMNLTPESIDGGNLEELSAQHQQEPQQHPAPPSPVLRSTQLSSHLHQKYRRYQDNR